ncbi:hypothetical protein FQA39_LY02486 [Lamprigera yunnana]|nr:hypothetical protein FQA39_LY02486 [Lamprigera yunnana]
MSKLIKEDVPAVLDEFGAGKIEFKQIHYEVVIPRKVTDLGSFVSHQLLHHYKRDYYANRDRSSMGPEDMVHYTIPIAGEEHHVQLVPNNGLVAPGMVVEVHDGKEIADRKIRRLRNAQCHYTGIVQGHDNSLVALSTCSGLTGYMRTKRGDFLIHPAEGHNEYSGKEHPHVIYSHDMEHPIHESTCETGADLIHNLARRSVTSERDESKNVTEYHIEAMVVIDKTMLDHHKEVDIESYVLTVFNMAHALYHDASLGTTINLAIVRLIRLEQEDNKLNLAVSKNAKRTLEYFEEWQHKMNPGDDNHPNHHDVAILLTRVDICGDENNCGLLGASVMGGICDAKHQAALCQDTGLRLGFVIAHEIGHTLALPHDDGKHEGCNAILHNGLSTVMNPSVNLRTAEWSHCSAKFLKAFIEQGYGKCLLDPPIDHSFEMPDILPGVMYGGDFQCKELLAPTAFLCDVGLECDNLICYIEEKGCIETHKWAASGTNCGEKKWCFRGKCLEVGERPGAIDGGWSAWSRWSRCSRTCGSGVKTRERHCTNPSPAQGGRYCSGNHKHHKICNTQTCEIGSPSFRNVQCAEFNEWVYPEDNQVHQWKAYQMINENPCILFCANDKGDVAALRPRVEDGTKCVRGLRDVCIDGICREIPCDLNLESNAVEDWCGVCRGNGTSCYVKSDQVHFLVNNTGKKSVTLIDVPKNALNIKIEETEPSDSKIQVINQETNSTVLEGDVPGVYNISGAKAWLGNIRTKQEALNIPGCVGADLRIKMQVLDDVVVKYSFAIPCESKRQPVFDWDYLDWGKCSAICGPGTEEAIPRCREKVAGFVDERYCKNQSQPKELVRPCEVAPCVPRWMIGDWQECSRCPYGKHARIVKCVMPTGEGEGEWDLIPDYKCVPPKPKEKEKCSCGALKSYKKRQDSKSSEEEVKFHPLDDNGGTTTTSPCSEESEKDGFSGAQKSSMEDVLNVQHLQVIVDKENLNDINLTIHNDGDEPACHTMNGTKTNTMYGKDALKFLDKLEKQLGNNKLK